jgi:hypothetical protein
MWFNVIQKSELGELSEKRHADMSDLTGNKPNNIFYSENVTTMLTRLIVSSSCFSRWIILVWFVLHIHLDTSKLDPREGRISHIKIMCFLFRTIISRQITFKNFHIILIWLILPSRGSSFEVSKCMCKTNQTSMIHREKQLEETISLVNIVVTFSE